MKTRLQRIGTVLATFIFVGAAYAQVPARIHYQGRLLQDTNLVNAEVGIELRLYDVLTGGSPNYSCSNLTPVVDGLYSTWLGEGDESGNLSDALAHDEVYIEVVADGTALSPRERLGAVAYAFKALGVNTGAITSVMLADDAVTADKIGAGVINSNHLAVNAVHSQHIALGAVGSGEIAAGAVTAAKIAPNSVGFGHLLKPYQSGVIDLEDLVAISNSDFSAYQTNVTTAFAVNFDNRPVVTLGLDTPWGFAAEALSPYIVDRATNEFTVRLSVPISPTPVYANDQNGQYMRMLDVNGHPAIYAQDFTEKTLIYSRAEDAYGYSWPTPIAIQTNGSPSYNSPAIVNGRPAVAIYLDGAGYDQLVYRRALDQNGDNWGAPVDVFTNQDIGKYVSMAMVNGHPAVACYDANGFDLVYVQASNINGTAWGNPVTIYTNGTTGAYCSMRIVNSLPAIAFYDYTEHDLMYVRALDANGATWDTPIAVYTNGYVGTHAHMEIVDGNPAIAFYDSVNDDLLYVRATDVNGAAWGTPVEVYTNDSVGTACSLEVINGRPAISFYDDTRDILLYSRAATTTGSSWNDPVIVDTNEQSGKNVTCLLEVQGAPAIGYMEYTAFFSKYVRSGNAPSDTAINWFAVEP